MNTRSELKAESLRRILDAGAKRLRAEGMSGAAIADVMRDAGLTHGAFYAHFANKTELSIASLQHALLDNRRRWVGAYTPEESWVARLQRLARKYLTKAHCDKPMAGCALGALATEAARSDEAFRQAYEAELLKSLQGICNGNRTSETPPDARFDDAIAFMSLCIGGLSLSRAVTDPALSERILQACVEAAARIPSNPENRKESIDEPSGV